jgi:hypothetical protein
VKIWPWHTAEIAAPPRIRPGSVKRVKVYGERKTGTTFVSELIRRNFIVPLLSGTPDRPNRAERKTLMEGIAGESAALRSVVLDRISNEENRRSIAGTLGWKHMFPPIAQLQSMPEFAAGTLFVVTVKHPVFWALSFHRAPIDSVYKARKHTFSQFLRRPFVPTLRDGVEAPYFPSVIDFYAHKIDGYRELQESGVRFALVRYEMLLNDVPGFLNLLRREHGLRRRGKVAVIREASTNSSKATFDEFREKYRLDGVRDAVSAEDWDFIAGRFGAERLAWLGYPPANRLSSGSSCGG